MIGALIAQGHSPRVAPLAAVWLHGAAADAFKADVGLVAGDIAPLAARELARLKSEIKSI
jgi:NAD(P)H-hydrate repair Nnr-like enzyme with NAD(P)H-hydrate dehydratase domain